MTTYDLTTSPAAGSAADRHSTPGCTFWACFCSWALIALDVQILTPAMKEMPAAIRSADDAGVVLIGTATLLSSAFGGWLAGALSDWVGRVPILRYTIICAALFTFLCGSAHSYAEFFVWRVLMGIGFGGVWAAAAIMVGEAFPERRGWWVGFMHSGWAVGWAFAYLAMPALAPALSVQFNIAVWHALFWGSAALVLPVLLLSLFVAESPVFTSARENHAGEVDFLEIFSPDRLWTTVLTCVLSIGTLTGYYVIVQWLPTFLAEQNLTLPGNSTSYQSFFIAGAFAGYVISAWLSDLDLLKRRGNFVLFALFAILTVSACIAVADRRIDLALEVRQTIILALAFPVGFFASGAFSGMGACFAELFPTRMRGSGAGFAYNFGRGVAAFILWLVGTAGVAGLPQALSSRLPPELSAVPALGLAIGVSVAIAYLLVVIAALLLPETRDRKDLTKVV
jgi:MFS family permease